MIRGRGVEHRLSPLGWRQMWAAVGDVAPWDQVISSPMLRCLPFATELASRFALPLAVEPLLHEIGMGDWEGRRRQDIAAQDPEAFNAVHADPVRNRPPNGERLEALGARVGEVYARQLASYPGRRLLIVCHAGVTRAILGYAMGADPTAWFRLRIDYAGVSRIRHGRFGPGVEFVNARRVR